MEAKKLRVQFERRVDSPWSWVVCLSSFIVQFLIIGTHNSFGSFFVALLEEFHRSEAETAWVGSLGVGVTFMAAPIATSLCARWGCRVVMCLGSVTYMAGMLLTSFVPHMSLMYLTHGVLVGFASSCCYFSSFHVLIIYFNKHLALANGIAAAGAGAGTMSISLVADKLISTYGLRTTFQCMAALSVLMFVAGLTFVPIDFREEDEKLKKKSPIKEQEQLKMKDRFITGIKELLKPAPVCGNKAFIAWTVAMAMTLIAYYIPYMFLVRLAEVVGVPSTQGALLVGYFAVAQTFGKIFFGKLGDSARVSRLTLTQISLLVIAVAACLCPLAQSYTALLTYSIVSGFFDGCLSVMIGLVTHDIVGRQMMAKAVGTMYGIVAIPMTIGPPMAGLLYDSTGSYNMVFFLSSGLVICGSCIMFLVPKLLPSTERLQKVIIPEIRVSSEEVLDFDDSFLEDQKDRLTSQFSLHSFAREFEVNHSRLLLDKTNLNSRPNSFVLFSIVPEGSFRDLSMSNERYSNSREASYTSLARLSEIRVDSRANSCAKLEPVEEAETSDASVSLEVLNVIIEPLTETIYDSTNEEKSEEVIVNSDNIGKESVPNIVISESTENCFVSEEYGVCTYNVNHDYNEIASSTSDLDEKRLSGYSWNSTESDLSCKNQYSDADTEDSGYVEELSQCQKEDTEKLGGSADGIHVYLSQDNLKPDNSFCNCDCTLDTKDNKTMLSGFEDVTLRHACSSKEGPLIIDPGLLDSYGQIRKGPSGYTCGEYESVVSGKGISDAKETILQSGILTPALPPPPDIYSELFEGILEEVNEYVESFSKMSDYYDSLKTWSKLSLTDLVACERETVV